MAPLHCTWCCWQGCCVQGGLPCRVQQAATCFCHHVRHALRWGPLRPQAKLPVLVHFSLPQLQYPCRVQGLSDVPKLTLKNLAGALQGLGDVSRTADRRASDAEAKALRLQRWKERNAGSSLVGTGSGSADGKSQPAAGLGTHHGHGGHRSRSQSKSPPARRRHSSQEDGELAGTLPCGVWACCMAHA